MNNNAYKSDFESPLLKKYFRDLKKHPPITKEEETELLKAAQRGSEAAKMKIVLSNLRFVISVAKKYRNINDIPFEELIAVGNLGLMKAAQRFDPDKNVRFISYAVWWIRQSIMQSLSAHKNPIRLPLNRVNMELRIKKARQTLLKQLNRKPTMEEIAEEIGITEQELSKFLRDQPSVISMDSTTVNSDEDLYLRDVIMDKDADLVKEIEKKVLDKEIKNVLDCLTEREQLVITYRFGLNDTKCYTLEEIGNFLGLTRERIRQIEANALKKLQNPYRSKLLKAFVTS
ncbi:MAG: RNA polymerase sigma factor RpoD/SigA [Candidatus Riflebacteria bacterium]|nr:RNA polymerase sigma factor RpoD/SigA [Candidatus Riflebacteria bacterium]